MREANTGQTITRGDVSITLDALRTSDQGTEFTYSYSLANGGQIEMIELPKIRLPNGQFLKNFEEVSAPTSGSQGTRDAKLPPIPGDTDNVSLNLSSAIVYSDSISDVKFSLSGHLAGIDLEEIIDRKDVSIEIPFSVGQAEFRFTSLILFPDTFALVYEPVNEAAGSKVFGGGLSAVSLSDDQGGAYSSFLSGVLWNTDQGHSVEFQAMYFHGLPNPEADNFNLRLDGAGEINGPFVFEVQLP